MKINSVVEGTKVNGPGFRLCVWVQGCKKHCPGCFNQEACRFDGGKEVPVSLILKLLDKQKYDGISVSGGEPFLQTEELVQLLKGAHLKGVNTLVFTGNTFEELYEQNNPALKECDYLIDGPYMQEIPSRCRFAGSGNQRFLQLKQGRIEKDLTLETEDVRECEIFIAEDGSIVTTGFADI